MPFSARDLIADPRFILGIRFHAGRMRDMFDAGPSACAPACVAPALAADPGRLCAEHGGLDGDASSGLTATALTSEITAFKAASRNTIRS